MQKSKSLTMFVQTLDKNKGFLLQFTTFVGQALLKETGTNYEKNNDITDKNEIIDYTDHNRLIDNEENDKT